METHIKNPLNERGTYMMCHILIIQDDHIVRASIASGTGFYHRKDSTSMRAI